MPVTDGPFAPGDERPADDSRRPLSTSHEPESWLRQWWRESIMMGPYRNQAWSATQVALCGTMPLALLLFIDRPDLTAYAVFGSLSSVYGGALDRRNRLWAQLGMGAMLTLAVVVGAVCASAGGGWTVIAAMAVMSTLGMVVAEMFGWLPVPSLFLVFTTGTISAQDHTWTDVPVAAGIAATAALFGVAIGQASQIMRHRRGLAHEPPAPRVPLSAVARAPGAAHRLAYYAVSPALAGTVASLVSFGHPYWAAVSATVPLSGRSTVTQVARATSRVAGTFVGLGLAFLVIAPAPPLWVLVLTVAICQVLTEMFVTRNYAVAVIFITPMAIILGNLGAPADAGSLVIDRFAQTVLGVVIAVAVLFVLQQRSAARN